MFPADALFPSGWLAEVLADLPPGLSHLATGTDAVGIGSALTLLAMSLLSWTLILAKLAGRLVRAPARRRAQRVWAATETVAEAERRMQRLSGADAWLELFADGRAAARWLERHGPGHAGDPIAAALTQALNRLGARFETGLTALASIGSTAPFVGLLGTVWGIQHALVAIAAAGSAQIDKIAGPVGEALIMTAFGLAVALPAVLAYNACTRGQRLLLAELEGFAHALHARLHAELNGVAAPAATADAAPPSPAPETGRPHPAPAADPGSAPRTRSGNRPDDDAPLVPARLCPAGSA